MTTCHGNTALYVASRGKNIAEVGNVVLHVGLQIGDRLIECNRASVGIKVVMADNDNL